MPRYLNTLAIIINHRRYLESDQIITLLTPKLGKLSVSSKGSTSAKSHRLGSLELGNLIKTQLYEKNDRYWLTDTVVISHTLSSAKSLTQLNLVFYFLEIINHFISENQHSEGAFQILQSLLESVDNNNFSKLIDYEIMLLEILGFGVPLQITNSFEQKQYPECQKLIKQFLESIIEKPLNSSKLFQ